MSRTSIVWCKITPVTFFFFEKKKKPHLSLNKKDPILFYLAKGFSLFTHNVPATWVVTWDFSSLSSLAKPKSETFGVKFGSRRTLLDLISLCTIWGWCSSWRKASPLATPMDTSLRVSQLNSILFCSEPINLEEKHFMACFYICFPPVSNTYMEIN